MHFIHSYIKNVSVWDPTAHFKHCYVRICILEGPEDDSIRIETCCPNTIINVTKFCCVWLTHHCIFIPMAIGCFICVNISLVIVLVVVVVVVIFISKWRQWKLIYKTHYISAVVIGSFHHRTINQYPFFLTVYVNGAFWLCLYTVERVSYHGDCRCVYMLGRQTCLLLGKWTWYIKLFNKIFSVPLVRRSVVFSAVKFKHHKSGLTHSLISTAARLRD